MQKKSKIIELELVLMYIKEQFDKCEDIIYTPIKFEHMDGCFIYLNELIDKDLFNELVFQSEQELKNKDHLTSSILRNSSLLCEAVLYENTEEHHKLLVDAILNGNILLLLNQSNRTYVFKMASSVSRSIEEPQTDQVVRGPRDGFIEKLDVNLLLIRGRIKSSSLKVEYHQIGKQTKTNVAVVYMGNIANQKIVEEVHRRLDRIDIDSILESNYIEEMIRDAPHSPFPTTFATERPDRVCGGLLEGKIAILTDGTPFVLTVPVVYLEFFQTASDYYDLSLPASILRWLRFFGLFVSIFLPGIYVALTTVHQDLLPSPLLIRIAGFREQLPLPASVEALVMLLTMELVREAGLRMPKTVGDAVSIVGTLVIGQAAVQAGIVGALMVIVVAITALSSFILPYYALLQLTRILTFPVVILSAMFGFMGIIIAILFLLAHIISLRSFGVPYLSPVAPTHKRGWKDIFYRAPWWAMKDRAPDRGVKNMKRSNTTFPRPKQNQDSNQDSDGKQK